MPRSALHTLTELQLLALAQANAITQCELVRSPGGWVIRVNGDWTVRSARKEVRHFARADTALAFLTDLQVSRVTVDLIRPA